MGFPYKMPRLRREWKFASCITTALVILYCTASAQSTTATMGIRNQISRSTVQSLQSSSSTSSSGPCKPEINGLSVLPSAMTPLTFNLAFIASMTNRGGDNLIGGAFFYAIDVLEEIANKTNIPVSFTRTVRDYENKETTAMRMMSDLYCYGNVSAFIGPAERCRAPGLLATAFNIPYMTFGCQDKHNETNPHGMINTDPSIAYVSKFILTVLRHFRWTSFWLVTGDDLHWQYTAEQLINNAEPMNVTLNGKTSLNESNAFAPMFHNSTPYADVIQASREHTRVYVFLGCSECLIVFLRQMQRDKLTESGHYVVIAATANSRHWSGKHEFYLTTDELKKNLTPDEKHKRLQAFRNVLLIEAKNQNSAMKEFEEEVYRRSIQPPFNYPAVPSFLSPPHMGQKVYHLYDATMLIGLSVMSLMGTAGADPTNASQVVRHIKGRKHCSKQGSSIIIHENGETEDSYEVRGCPIVHGKVQQAFDIIGAFTQDKGVLEYTETFPLWPADDVPVSEPECGFQGERCEDTSTLPGWAYAIIAVVVFVSLVVITIVVIGVYRHFNYEKKLERLLWKIEISEIVFMNSYQIHEMSTPRPKKKESLVNTSLSTILLQDSPDTSGLPDPKAVSSDQPLVGTYKGCTVFVKQMTRRHLELTRNLKMEFQLRKELTHENINRFIGACIDTPTVSIVTQYCSRKSLQGILQDNSLPQEEMFITSLVQDLINGMAFIHESDLGCHGNLKSSNCLVDRRWTLKISDFGFGAMGPPPAARGDDEKAFAKLLWTAPEFLQRRFTSSSSYVSQNNSSTISQSLSQSLRPSRTFSSLQHQRSSTGNNSRSNADAGASNVKANQKGDVYSFAIILYQLYGQTGPWGNIGYSPREIVEKLLEPCVYDAPFRPDTQSLRCDQSIIDLMRLCWDDNPEERPDFKYTIRIKFKHKQQGSLMEVYADNLETLVAERTEQLRKEKKMTENLLLRMLPRPVADRLMRGQPVQPEQFDCVTIYFSDIVGFTELSAESAPMEVVNLLNDLYTLFDSVIHKFLVYKVETIGDAYMVVSGLPNSIGDSHAGEIASMSLLFLKKLKEKRFTVRGQTDYMLKLRIGIHSGPCCAGVVGLKMPRYCLFGDTVNTANRMESTGEALKIHCSVECKDILDKLGGYQLEKRGHTEVKGKGQLLTYFLIGEDDHVRQKRLCAMTNSGRCVSVSNLDYSGTPLNRRSAPPLSCIPPHSPKHNGLAFRSSSMSLPHNHNNSFSSSLPFRGGKHSSAVVPSSLNTSMDSTISAPFYPNDSLDSETHSISDFRTCNTLPRPPVARQNSFGAGGGGCCGVGQSMSPIAEDPWSPSALVLHDKGFTFHDNGGLYGSSDTESECDTLLKPLPSSTSTPVAAVSGMSSSVKRNNSLVRQSSHSGDHSSPSPVLSPLVRHNSTPGTPETVL